MKLQHVTVITMHLSIVMLHQHDDQLITHCCEVRITRQGPACEKDFTIPAKVSVFCTL